MLAYEIISTNTAKPFSLWLAYTFGLPFREVNIDEKMYGIITEKTLYDQGYLLAAKRSKSWINWQADLYNMALPNRIHQKLWKNYVEPDISVICDRHNLNDRSCSGTPSYIIEIASLSSRRMYYNCKNGLYMDAGIHEYWIVGPEKERTTIYRFDEDATPTIASFEQDIPVGIYEDLVINIAEILNIWRLQR